MTELLIVSKPRGRIFKWIGGGIYKEYKPQASASRSDSVSNIVYSDTSFTEQKLYSATSPRWESFTTADKQNLALERVKIYMKRVGSPTGTLYVELWNAGGSSKIADIGSKDVSTISMDWDWYDFIPSSKIALGPSTTYRIYMRYDGGDESNYIGLAYYDSIGRYGMEIRFKFVDVTLQVDLDFIYSGTGEKRLEISTSGGTVTKITMNGEDIGTSLSKDKAIPQEDNYSFVFTFDTTSNSYTFTTNIQRYLYYGKTSITLDDLDVSEAYLQEIEFGGSGGVLRVDDSPDSDLVGSANETLQFTDILVPFRKLEWISGGGEVLILGVE